MTTPKRKSSNLTTRTVDALKPRQAASESLGYGAGALEAQGKKDGARYFFRYGKPQRRVPLPDYNDEGEPVSLAEARTKARALSARFLELQAEGRDLLETLQTEKLAAEKAREAERLAAEQAEQAEPEKPVTLSALMAEYADWLEERGKIDFRDVRNITKNHIDGAFPELAGKPAADIKLEDVLFILQRLLKAKKRRTASKARAYIRAAYAAAISARMDAAGGELRRFGIETNPAAGVAAIEDSTRPRERALSLAELRALWQRINRPEEHAGPALRFYLLTGGQRFAQIRRATRADIREGELVLWDGKGRRTKPRRHAVPLLPEALEAAEAMTTPRLGEYLLSLTHGETPADGGAVRRAVAELAGRMVEAGEAAEPFTLSDLRRTIETRLAAEGVPLEARAHLQSHGLGGLQARHYDKHSYSAEKLAALKKLRALMTEPPATVASLDEARKAKQ
ncbi:site-specific integrase [Wenzhouxiangella limi]|uniref:Integrase n=1 Tax=Wenzhouxiangella limi TaxID=2707351 RepID=A0A845UVE8_9GAMM|nr:hypothetical protein [Wenzhouxiangella limi]NDY95457.1 hypothetical protein [Wenzhouxiangella limi]